MIQRYLLIQDGVVVNAIMANDKFVQSQKDQLFVASDTAQVGDAYINGAFLSRQKPIVVKPSRDQAIQKLEESLEILRGLEAK